jgi:hypothetical protein
MPPLATSYWIVILLAVIGLPLAVTFLATTSAGGLILTMAPLPRLVYALVLALAAGIILFAYLSRRRRMEFERLAVSSFGDRMLAQCAVLFVVGVAVYLNGSATDPGQTDIVPSIDRSGWCAVAAAAAAVAVIAALASRQAHGRGGEWSGVRAATAVLALLLLLADAALAIPLVQNLNGVVDTFHRDYLFNELLSASLGAYPGISFTSQYSTVYPYLVWCGSKVLGSPVQAVVVLVTLGNLAILASVFVLIWYCTRRAIATLLLVGAIELVWVYVPPGGTARGMTSYWAVDPLRYMVFPVLVLLLVTTRPVARLSAARVTATACLVVVAVEFNLEWGLAVFAGLLVLVVVDSHGRWSAAVRTCGVLITAVVTVLSGIALLRVLGGAPVGAFPEVTFSRWAAMNGALQADRLQALGFQWVMIATLLATLLAGLGGVRLAGTEKVSRAMVLFSVFGLCALSYFFFRPFASTALSLSLIWAVCGALLVVWLVALLVNHGFTRRRTWLPGAAAMLLIAVAPVGFARMPDYAFQRDRLSGDVPQWQILPHDLRPLIAAIPAAQRGRIGVISQTMGVDAAANGLHIGLPLNSPEYLAERAFQPLACTWLRGRFSALIVFPTDTQRLVFAATTRSTDGGMAETLRCAGYAPRGAVSFEGADVGIWAGSARRPSASGAYRGSGSPAGRPGIQTGDGSARPAIGGVPRRRRWVRRNAFAANP